MLELESPRPCDPLGVPARFRTGCADPFYPDFKFCSHARPQGFANRPERSLALGAELRHGSCLLVPPMVAAPMVGGVNEEIAA